MLAVLTPVIVPLFLVPGRCRREQLMRLCICLWHFLKSGDRWSYLHEMAPPWRRPAGHRRDGETNRDDKHSAQIPPPQMRPHAPSPVLLLQVVQGVCIVPPAGVPHDPRAPPGVPRAQPLPRRPGALGVDVHRAIAALVIVIPRHVMSPHHEGVTFLAKFHHATRLVMLSVRVVIVERTAMALRHASRGGQRLGSVSDLTRHPAHLPKFSAHSHALPARIGDSYSWQCEITPPCSTLLMAVQKTQRQSWVAQRPRPRRSQP